MSTEVRITDPVTGGQKGSKLERYDLMPFDALNEIARVYAFGATKYADHNWLRGYKWSLSSAALLRHVAQWMLGEDRDSESGCHHLAHAAWHCLTLLTFCFRGIGTDDRMPARAVIPDVAPSNATIAPRWPDRKVPRDDGRSE
jgi:hypothetical protein